MQRHHTTKKLAWFLTLSLVGVGLVAGCDKEITIKTNNGSGQVGGDNNPTVTPPDNNPIGHDHDDDHGPDDDEVLIAPGFLNGSWRVATASEDQPLAYFDVFHDIDAPAFTGTFWMGHAISDLLDDEVGDIISGAWQGNALEIRWNPTMDEEEVYVITNTVRIDENRLEGKFQATKAPIEFDVVIDRRVFEDEPEIED